jgi:hypothetical protein
MSETALPKRQEVDPKLTWDLTPIFADEFAYTEAIKQVRALTKDFVHLYQGKLTEPAIIVDALGDYGSNLIVKLDTGHLCRIRQIPLILNSVIAKSKPRL